MNSRLALLGAIFTVMAAPSLASAQRAEPEATKAPAISAGTRLAATCVACHGTAGATRGNTLPPLAGQPRDTLLAALLAFKAGTREATIMTQLAKGYTDEQLALLASYFAAQKKEQP
ncbi:MAG: c-type cytochrome [Duganella sp.]